MRGTNKNDAAPRTAISGALAFAAALVVSAAVARDPGTFSLSPPKRELVIRLAADDPPAIVRLAEWYCFPGQVRDYLINRAQGWEQEKLDPRGFVKDSVEMAKARFEDSKPDPDGLYRFLHYDAEQWRMNLDANLRLYLNKVLERGLKATVDAPPGGKQTYLFNCYTRAEVELFIRMVDFLYNQKLTEMFRAMQRWRIINEDGKPGFIDIASGSWPLPPGGLTDGKPAYDKESLGPINYEIARKKYPEKYYKNPPSMEKWKPRPLRIVVYRAPRQAGGGGTLLTGVGTPDAGWRVAGDNAQWCSYWGWKEEVPWFPEGGLVVPPEEEEPPEEAPEPPDEGGPPEPPVTTKEEPEEEKRPPTRPPVYVKAKRGALRSGEKAQAVAGFQLKLLAAPPPLPLAGNARDDRGYDEGPLQATTDSEGRAMFPGAAPGGSGHTSGRGGERRFFLSFGDLIAQAHAAPAAPPVTVELEVPEFDSYTAKIRIDRSRKRWDDPASYLEPPHSWFVVRHWIVGDVMYVVINMPRTGGEQTP